MPFFTNQLYKAEEWQNCFAKEPGPHFGPRFKLNPFCGLVRFSQLWVFSVLISAFPSLLLPNFQVKASAPEYPSDTPRSGGAGAVLPQHLAQASCLSSSPAGCLRAQMWSMRKSSLSRGCLQAPGVRPELGLPGADTAQLLLSS